MTDTLRPPHGWTLYHSIALLLVGASVIDGELDPGEVSRIRERLQEYPDVGGPGEAKALLKLVVPYYRTLREAGAVMTALDRHSGKLAKALPSGARRVVVDDVMAVIGADEQLHPRERDYVASLCRHFGLEVPNA